MGLFIKNKRRGRKIINHHIVAGTRESHPRVHDLQHPQLGKPRCGLQIMDTRMGFPCPFHSVVIDSIILELATWKIQVIFNELITTCPLSNHIKIITNFFKLRCRTALRRG